MTEKTKWHKSMMEPGLMRVSTTFFLIAWGLAALWSWVLVEPTVLRNNEAARNYVAWAMTWFPWLTQLHALGPQAEKGLFLHSVYWALMVPFGAFSGIASFLKPASLELIAKSSALKTFRDVVICFGALSVCVWAMYFALLKPSQGELHRTGYSLTSSFVGVPLLVPFLVGSLWAGFFAGVGLTLSGVKKIFKGSDK